MLRQLTYLVTFILVGSLAGAATTTDQLPKFDGATWAIVDPADQAVSMLVFENGAPGRGRLIFYNYQLGTRVLRELSTAPFETTATGYQVQDQAGNWHSFVPIGENALEIDGNQPIDATKVTGIVRNIVMAICTGGCAAGPCQGNYNETCCGCCTCMHTCWDIEFMDWLCCFYLYGGTGACD